MHPATGIRTSLLTHALNARQRREMLGLPPGDTDPQLDGLSDGEPDFDEPMELVESRARLAEAVALQGAAAMLGEALLIGRGGAWGAAERGPALAQTWRRPQLMSATQPPPPLRKQQIPSTPHRP